MPSYDYFCEANKQTIEVRHGIKERLKTWKEVCDRAGIPPGKTPADASVVRLVGQAMIMDKPKSSSSAASSLKGPCSHGGCGCFGN